MGDLSLLFKSFELGNPIQFNVKFSNHAVSVFVNGVNWFVLPQQLAEQFHTLAQKIGIAFQTYVDKVLFQCYSWISQLVPPDSVLANLWKHRMTFFVNSIYTTSDAVGEFIPVPLALRMEPPGFWNGASPQARP